MMRSLWKHCAGAALGLAILPASAWAALDLSRAVIVSTPADGVVGKAAVMLQEEMAERCGVKLAIGDAAVEGAPAILLGTVDSVPGVAVPEKAESYGIAVDGDVVKLVGRDTRGALFAAGRLIRLAEYGENTLSLELPQSIATAPDKAYRAHQIAYRPTANCFDAWTVETYEQYIRDLVMFGCNGIELIPRLNKEKIDGPVMAESAHSMNIKLSKLLSSYGLDLWLWTTVMDDESDDVTTPEGVAKAVEKRRAIFADYPDIDHVFVPGGDGGEAPAPDLMNYLKALAPVLKQLHPDCKLWVSNQTFTIEENNFFFDYLAQQKPEWLAGVVYGPWTSMGIEEMRERTPDSFQLRLYPDITHTVRCQYPVPDWDPAFANTVGREPIMPRPVAIRHIYLLYKDLNDGFGSYSDGNHDDLNKSLWSQYGWDPSTDLDTFLVEYGKAWWGAPLAQDVATGLKMLEKNWEGPIASNTTIPKTLELWESISKRCPDFDSNWRAQMYLFRARFDQYVQKKAALDKQYGADALAALAKAPDVGVEKAVASARAALAQGDKPVDRKLRRGIEKLGPMLLKSIGYQLSVEPPYLAANPERGAMLDWLDQPLNDRPWLEARFAAITAMPDKAQQLEAIDRIVHWTDAGPGGFYDNLGAVGEYSHVVFQRPWEDDPSGSHTPRADFPLYKADTAAIAKAKTAAVEAKPTVEEANAALRKEPTKKEASAAPQPRQELRMSWQSQIATHYGTPLKMHYEGLDPKASYTLRVTYAGRYKPTMVLTLNDTYAVHGPVKQPDPIWPLEYYIPREVTQNGTLDLEWNLVDGRGCMVSEVWLIKK